MANAQTLETMSPGLLKGVERAQWEPAGRFNALAPLIDVPAVARAYHRQRAGVACRLALGETALRQAPPLAPIPRRGGAGAEPLGGLPCQVGAGRPPGCGHPCAPGAPTAGSHDLGGSGTWCAARLEHAEGPAALQPLGAPPRRGGAREKTPPQLAQHRGITARGRQCHAQERRPITPGADGLRRRPRREVRPQWPPCHQGQAPWRHARPAAGRKARGKVAVLGDRPRVSRKGRDGVPEATAACATRALSSGKGSMGGGWRDRATPQRLCIGRCHRIIYYKTIR